MRRDPSVVAVLVFDRAPLFELSVPMSVFGGEALHGEGPLFTLLPVAAEPGPVRTNGGLQLDAPHGLDTLDRAGTIVVPTWRDARERPAEPILAALQAAHADGAVVVGLCLGAFVLAAAGLLDRRRAATHWSRAPLLASSYPDIEVDADVLFVDEGDVLTSAGSAAGIDACLHLVRRTHGPAAATAIARRMVVPPQRSGGQAQYIEHPVPQHRSGGELEDVLAYALAHLGTDLHVDDLAARAHLSRRTFDRRFRATTGGSPLQWLRYQRVLHAQRLLEGTDLSVDQVARRVGLSTGVSLRPHFRRVVGVSPQRYRDTFRARAVAAVG